MKALALCCLLVVAGCNPWVKPLPVLVPQDFNLLPAGTEITAPEGEPLTTTKPGAFMSQFYMEEVMKVRTGPQGGVKDKMWSWLFGD